MECYYKKSVFYFQLPHSNFAPIWKVAIREGAQDWIINGLALDLLRIGVLTPIKRECNVKQFPTQSCALSLLTLKFNIISSKSYVPLEMSWFGFGELLVLDLCWIGADLVLVFDWWGVDPSLVELFPGFMALKEIARNRRWIQLCHSFDTIFSTFIWLDGWMPEWGFTGNGD